MKVLAIFAILLPYIASRSVEVQRQMCRSNDPMCEMVYERSLEEMTLSPRALDPKGYKVNIVVFYDDAFAKEFGVKAVDEVKKIVSLANVEFGHKSLTPKIQLTALAIEQAKGQSWTGDDSNPYLVECGKLAKAYKISDANTYICLGGKPKLHAAGGVTMKGTVCDKNLEMRPAYIQYVTMSGDTGETLNAVQQTKQTATVMAHEIGHTLGMDHDFHGQDSSKLKNNPSGKGKCTGIMDYTDSTGGWSKCSNADIQKFLNGLKKNCLIPIGTAGRSTEWSEGIPEGGMAPPTNPGECKPPLCIIE